MSTKHTPRIRLVGGEWYAFAPNRSKQAGQFLWSAIGFCKRLNSARQAKAKGAAS